MDEEGTVAAAATAVIMNRMAAISRPEPYVLNFDRPFVFAVQHANSGAVLVAGAVMQP